MTSKPSWLTKQTPVFDRSTGVVFMPVQLKTDGKQKFAIDAESVIYSLSDCEPATPETFTHPRTFITPAGFRVTVERCSEGLLVNGQLRVLLNELMPVAKRLAETFNGEIVRGAVDLFRFGIEEATHDDW